MYPRRGEVFWAPADKRRPVLIVSADEGNEHSNAVVGAAITTNIRDPQHPTTVRLAEGEPLDQECEVRCRNLFTLLKEDLDGPYGQLGPDKMDEVDAALAVALDLGARLF